MTTNPGAVSLQNSTNVRSGVAAAVPAPIKVLTSFLPPLSRAWPRAAGACADWVFFTPWRARRSTPWAPGGTPFVVRSGGVDVRGMRWGRGPTVFLVHGWEGSGAQMGPFVAPLVDQGYEVISWDAPGHGASGGWRSSMVAIADAIRDVARAFGAPHAAIAHSLGGSALLFAAARGLAVKRLVLVGTPSRPITWADSMARLLGLSAAGMAAMKQRVEQRLGVGWDELDVPTFAASVAAPTLVLHDQHDKEVPVADAGDIAEALPDSVLRLTSTLGHRRVLRDPDVVDVAARFVAGGARPLPWTAAGLEQELFERDRRRA